MFNLIRAITIIYLTGISSLALSTSCHINQAGLQLVEEFEGFYATPYWDSYWWAVGYGTHGPDIKPGVVWNRDYAEQRLLADLQEDAHVLCTQLRVPLTANQFSALVSLAYNTGITRVLQSQLFRVIQSGSPDAAGIYFLDYTHSANGTYLEGLARRRIAESELYNKRDN